MYKTNYQSLSNQIFQGYNLLRKICYTFVPLEASNVSKVFGYTTYCKKPRKFSHSGQNRGFPTSRKFLTHLESFQLESFWTSLWVFFAWADRPKNVTSRFRIKFYPIYVGPAKIRRHHPFWWFCLCLPKGTPKMTFWRGQIRLTSISRLKIAEKGWNFATGVNMTQSSHFWCQIEPVTSLLRHYYVTKAEKLQK